MPIELKHKRKLTVHGIVVYAIKLTDGQNYRITNRCKFCSCSRHSTSELRSYCINIGSFDINRQLLCNNKGNKFIVSTKELLKETLRKLK